MRLAFFAVLLVPVLMPSSSHGADTVTHRLWLDYHHKQAVRLNLELHNELGYRQEFGSPSATTLYTRPMIRWHSTWNLIETRLGVGAFYTWEDPAPDLLEVRPTLDGLLKWPMIGRATIVSRLRVEDRFEWTADGDFEDVWRLRTLISTKVPLGGRSPARQFFVPLSAEGFFKVGSGSLHSGSATFRFATGMGAVLGSKWVTMIEGIVQGSESDGENSFETTDFILRLQVQRLGAKDYMSTR